MTREWGKRYRCAVRYFVYLLASRNHGTLYCGITNNLLRRVWEHKTNQVSGFTEKYNVKRLVWWEGHSDVDLAIRREKRIKRWRRAWKIALIERENPDWLDRYEAIGGTRPESLIPEGRRAWETRHR